MRPTELINIAIHEAGHVAAYLWFEIPFLSVTVIPGIHNNIEYGGRVVGPPEFPGYKFEEDENGLHRSTIEVLIALLSGEAAEKKLNGNADMHFVSEHDMKAIVGTLVELISDQDIITSYLSKLKMQSKLLFDHQGGLHDDTARWGYVVKLSDRLQQKKEMSYDECLELYQSLQIVNS
ncbi:MAG: hypothetical protein ABIX01_11905 [Chitinophagaceae bacterium]